MNLRIYMLFFVFFVSIVCHSQINDSSICSTQNLAVPENVTAYIKGKKGKTYIKWKFFYKGFEIGLTDTSYKINGFHLTWDVQRLNKDMIISRVIKGSKVSVEINKDIPGNNDYSLSTIAPGIILAFDDIIAIKDGICYRIPSFLVYTVLKKEH